uniref:Uncharacterized protein n=1 Tax=Wuchereria bancrofti TaxID=6293 RepID=A0A1I8EX03_WUCBA
MAKIEVQIRSCFCCGLSLATVLIAFYTLLLYSLLTGLASWGLSDTTANGDSSHYTNCDLEALGKVRSDNRKLTFHQGATPIVIEDSSSYHCSFGLYTEELIFSYTWRRSTLWNLVRIATGIFFLGLQFFHISLVIIMIAKFQRMHNRNIGNVIDGDKQYDARTVYPTLPSNYAYSPQMRRDQMYYTDQRDPRVVHDTMYRQPQQIR